MNEGNIAKIAAETGIHEFHFSARETVQSAMTYRNENVSMGGTVRISEFERNVTTHARVEATISSLKRSLH